MMDRFLRPSTQVLLEISVQQLSATFTYKLAKQDGLFKIYKQVDQAENGKFIEIAVVFEEKFVERRNGIETSGTFFNVCEHLARREDRVAFSFASKRFISFLENEFVEG